MVAFPQILKRSSLDRAFIYEAFQRQHWRQHSNGMGISSLAALRHHAAGGCEQHAEPRLERAGEELPMSSLMVQGVGREGISERDVVEHVALAHV